MAAQGQSPGGKRDFTWQPHSEHRRAVREQASGQNPPGWDDSGADETALPSCSHVQSMCSPRAAEGPPAGSISSAQADEGTSFRRGRSQPSDPSSEPAS